MENRTRFLLFLIGGFFTIFIYSASSLAVQSEYPLSIIRLPENENAILVEKKTQTLRIYTQNQDALSISLSVSCSTGEVAGVKQKAGDKKTPEGIYFLIDEYEDRYLTPVYGKRAFPTDYPNFIDKRQGKNGSAIWIHGTNKALKPMDSNGCIALENDNVVKLSDYITLDSTPVIMIEELKMGSKSQVADQEKELIVFLENWLNSMMAGTYHAYLANYSPSYLPNLVWWEQWDQLRNTAVSESVSFKLEAEKIGIYHYNDIFVLLFDLFINIGDKKMLLGKRKLFVQKNEDSCLIIGDPYQKVTVEFEKADKPMISALRSYTEPAIKNKNVLKMVNQWLAAWSSKDMDHYASFYAENFFSDGLNKAVWVKRKRQLAKKYNYINVVGTDFKVKSEKNKCEVVFFQEYESSGFTTQGTKRLKLIDEGGLWKIYQESWKKR